MEERKLYAVTEGDYSDYRIVGLFDDRAKAEAYADHFGGEFGTMTVEDYEANPEPEGERWIVGVYARVGMDGGSEAPTHTYPSAVRPGSYPSFNEYYAKHHPERAFCGFGPTFEHARRQAEQFRRECLVGQHLDIYPNRKKG
jgi:hypothetical protein